MLETQGYDKIPCWCEKTERAEQAGAGVVKYTYMTYDTEMFQFPVLGLL